MGLTSSMSCLLCPLQRPTQQVASPPPAWLQQPLICQRQGCRPPNKHETGNASLNAESRLQQEHAAMAYVLMVWAVAQLAPPPSAPGCPSGKAIFS